MALRRLPKQAASLLQRSTTTSSSSNPSITNPTIAAGRYGLPAIWSRCSNPVLQVHHRVSKFRTFFTAQTLLRVRVHSSGPKLRNACLVGASALASMMLYPENIAHSLEERPSNIVEPSGFFKDEINTFWSLAKKYQLPAVLLFMIALGWRNPITLIINILLLFYCTRPNPYSIYLFLQQIHERETREGPKWWNNEFLYTKNVHAEDYKFFSLGRIELRNRTVVRVIGVLGGWWVFDVSYL